MGSIEKRVLNSPLLPAGAAIYLIVAHQPFASGNTVSLVLLFVCGLWLTSTFRLFAKSGGFVGWLLGTDPNQIQLQTYRKK
jgi:hypothetical protein